LNSKRNILIVILIGAGVVVSGVAAYQIIRSQQDATVTVSGINLLVSCGANVSKCPYLTWQPQTGLPIVSNIPGQFYYHTIVINTKGTTRTISKINETDPVGDKGISLSTQPQSPTIVPGGKTIDVLLTFVVSKNLVPGSRVLTVTLWTFS
jgi:hypothetical protein